MIANDEGWTGDNDAAPPSINRLRRYPKIIYSQMQVI
jgi:hypothetical protein